MSMSEATAARNILLRQHEEESFWRSRLKFSKWHQTVGLENFALSHLIYYEDNDAGMMSRMLIIVFIFIKQCFIGTVSRWDYPYHWRKSLGFGHKHFVFRSAIFRVSISSLDFFFWCCSTRTLSILWSSLNGQCSAVKMFWSLVLNPIL